MERVQSHPTDTTTRTVGTCRCGLPLEPPAHVEWWRPDLDVDPGHRVHTMVRFGDNPALRRLARRHDGTGWSEDGAMVAFYGDITPPLPWADIGRCWADAPHAVIAVRQEADGSWRTAS